MRQMYGGLLGAIVGSIGYYQFPLAMSILSRIPFSGILFPSAGDDCSLSSEFLPLLVLVIESCVFCLVFQGRATFDFDKANKDNSKYVATVISCGTFCPKDVGKPSRLTSSADTISCRCGGLSCFGPVICNCLVDNYELGVGIVVVGFGNMAVLAMWWCFGSQF